MCPKYIFWQKKEIKAKDLNEAIKVEKKFKYKFDSVAEQEDKSENDLTPCIGFTEYQEEDFE